MEANRAAKDLKDQVGIETAFVVANYLLPEEYGDNAFFANYLLPEEYGDNAFFANWRAQQQQYLGEIKERFETPMMLAPLRQDEPIGLNELSVFGDEVTRLDALDEQVTEVPQQ